ncbi:MAG: hypothetical protein LAO51_14815, partial [Acidobacteriia bacterium]|nr:hypothetical protein [Terriglobia bacterium]
MSRKAILDEAMEYDEVTPEEVAEAQAEVEAAARAARRRRSDKDVATDRPTAAILPIYLREM